ncbi:MULTISPECIES: hypothetical protein [Rhizobium]|uniref:General stress protein 17M-like domain-containing protein n=1 Tax=Rhizobium bangladeshense TaxID=1138189 RepID=A0ABS7LGP7_9HYPH|nr:MULTISPECIES: hypothetical protein [Rhizobium]MBX4867970.1 hypothetical protein [Rhizobium bangladeshense]MBX4875260.1 hypothetical protein [Rhizobium bangladeshense]MBX4886172.1 hypothetical protein [Rhizobium bangladeshense]MBX4889558.1 hypothetical protein [Rhizobium bangladeshense]MBX4895224.1 hypothetical protein [Rhizobium bangladeshense]
MSNIHNDTNPASSGPMGGGSLTAFFDSRSEAESAVSRLEDAGVPVARIRLMPGYEADEKNAGVISDDRSGFFDALADFFFPDEDRAMYAEGLRRGGFLVQVNDIDDALYETVHDILDDEGSIDIDERADLWLSESGRQGGSNTGFAGSAHGGKAAEDLAVSESAFEGSPAGDARWVAVRDTAHGSAKVRAYTFSEGSTSSNDQDRQSQTQSQGGSHQSQGFRRDH